MTTLDKAIVVVTGGNRGIGRAIALEALARGAKKVYTTSRLPSTSDDPRVVPLVADVTDQESVDALATAASDATIIVNNAGVPSGGGIIESSLETTRAIIETNLIGPIRVAKAFAPILAANGNGAIINVASVASWMPGTGAYGISKAGLWNFSHSIGSELVGHGTQVLSAHLGFTDTDMTALIDAPKNSPEFVATSILDALEAGRTEALVDEAAKQAKSTLNATIAVHRA